MLDEIGAAWEKFAAGLSGPLITASSTHI